MDGVVAVEGRVAPGGLAGVPAVEARGVSKSFGDTVALHELSLAIGRGEFFSLLGPSGCGKTTLLRMIGGFETPTTGEIRIDGASVSGLPPYARTTNMIFQHLALFPHISVFENVAFGLRVGRRPRAEIRRKVEEALALVRLEGYGKRMVNELSGGQRQRVAMARALVNEPSVLLLDEPLGALDLQLRIQMQAELRRLQRAVGSTFVFVTHDQGEAMAMSDRIAVMEAGRILQIGTPEAIYERPASRAVAAFVGHTNLYDGTVAEVRDGRCLVDCGTIRLAAAADGAGVEAGRPVSVALRYERVAADAVDVADGEGAEGIVEERSFLGNAVRLVVRAGGGASVVADVPPGSPAAAAAIGDRVSLAWSPADVRLLLS